MFEVGDEVVCIDAHGGVSGLRRIEIGEVHKCTRLISMRGPCGSPFFRKDHECIDIGVLVEGDPIDSNILRCGGCFKKVEKKSSLIDNLLSMKTPSPDDERDVHVKKPVSEPA